MLKKRCNKTENLKMFTETKQIRKKIVDSVIIL